MFLCTCLNNKDNLPHHILLNISTMVYTIQSYSTVQLSGFSSPILSDSALHILSFSPSWAMNVLCERVLHLSVKHTFIISLSEIMNDSLDISTEPMRRETCWYEDCFAYKQWQCCNGAFLSPYRAFFSPHNAPLTSQEEATPPQNILKHQWESKRTLLKEKNSAKSNNKVLWECLFSFKRAPELRPFPQCHLLGHTAQQHSQK